MNEILETYCSTCAHKVSACEETRAEHLKVRDAWVDVDQVVLTCLSAEGASGTSPGSKAPICARAYEVYREGQGLLSASQIRDAYDSYGLSQASFGKLLGLGGATLSRYENGGVQTRQIDQAIRAASDPHAMLDLLAEKGAEIPAAQRGRAEQRGTGEARSRSGVSLRVCRRARRFLPRAQPGGCVGAHRLSRFRCGSRSRDGGCSSHLVASTSSSCGSSRRCSMPTSRRSRKPPVP